jgi:hypothetical protein
VLKTTVNGELVDSGRYDLGVQFADLLFQMSAKSTVIPSNQSFSYYKAQTLRFSVQLAPPLETLQSTVSIAVL